MSKKRRYFGQAQAEKVWIGSKSVDLRLDQAQGLILAEKILKAANASRTMDIAVYLRQASGAQGRITVTSKD